MLRLKAPSAALFSLLGLPLLLVQKSGASHCIEFAPAEGLALTKTFSSITIFESDEIVFAINGDEEAFPPRCRRPSKSSRT